MLAQQFKVAKSTLALALREAGLPPHLFPPKGHWQQRSAGGLIALPDEVQKVFPNGLPPSVKPVGRQIRLKRPGLAVFLRMVWEMKADDIASQLKWSKSTVNAKSGGGICPGRSRPTGSKHRNNGSRRKLSNCCWGWTQLPSSPRWENSAKHQSMSNAPNESRQAIFKSQDEQLVDAKGLLTLLWDEIFPPVVALVKGTTGATNNSFHQNWCPRLVSTQLGQRVSEITGA